MRNRNQQQNNILIQYEQNIVLLTSGSTKKIQQVFAYNVVIISQKITGTQWLAQLRKVINYFLQHQYWIWNVIRKQQNVLIVLSSQILTILNFMIEKKYFHCIIERQCIQIILLRYSNQEEKVKQNMSYIGLDISNIDAIYKKVKRNLSHNQDQEALQCFNEALIFYPNNSALILIKTLIQIYAIYQQVKWVNMKKLQYPQIIHAFIRLSKSTFFKRYKKEIFISNLLRTEIKLHNLMPKFHLRKSTVKIQKYTLDLLIVIKINCFWIQIRQKSRGENQSKSC